MRVRNDKRSCCSFCLETGKIVVYTIHDNCDERAICRDCLKQASDTLESTIVIPKLDLDLPELPLLPELPHILMG